MSSENNVFGYAPVHHQTRISSFKPVSLSFGVLCKDRCYLTSYQPTANRFLLGLLCLLFWFVNVITAKASQISTEKKIYLYSVRVMIKSFTASWS